MVLFLIFLALHGYSSHISRVFPYINTSCTTCVNSAVVCQSTRLTAPVISLRSWGGSCNGVCQEDWSTIVPYEVQDVDSAFAWDPTFVEVSTPVKPVSSFVCQDGYFVFGVGYTCSSGQFTRLICKRPVNLPIAPPIITQVAEGLPASCPVGQYMVGFKVGVNTRYSKTSLLCAPALDTSCDNPVDADASANIVSVSSSCTVIHQWCTVTVKCKPFFEPASGSATVECRPAQTTKGVYNTSVLRCSDINECANVEATCGANSTCTNVVGGPPTCGCVAGFTRTNNACVNVDECRNRCTALNETNPVQQQCNNCPSGTSCNDTQGGFVCTVNADPCSTKCNDTVTTNCYTCSSLATSCSYTNFPAYSCSCPDGYSSSDQGRTCLDVDECVSGTSMCDVSSTKCDNVNGSYGCTCLSGFQRASAFSCVPINECLNASACPSSSQCIDTNPFYYCLPQIRNVSKGNVTSPFTLSSTSQQPPDVVSFTILRESSCLRTNNVFYGANNKYQTSACVVSNSSSGDGMSYVLECDMDKGAGANLSFSLQCCPSVPISQPCMFVPAPLFVFSYPRPTLSPETLTYLASPDLPGVVYIDASQAGLVVTMQGTNFLVAETLVYFGSSSDRLMHSCNSVSVLNASMLTCVPQVVVGANFTFTVVVGTGANAQMSDVGVDLLSFVGDPPVVYDMVGCVKNGIGIKDCPTEGGVAIWVKAKTANGLSLTSPELFIDGNLCVQQRDGTNYSEGFWCLLPAGSGEGLQVELRDMTASWFGAIVSYAPPQITQISSDSCVNLSSLVLVNCSAPLLLSITGNNFGTSGAVVVVESDVVQAAQVPYLGVPSTLNGNHKYIIATITSPIHIVNNVMVRQLNGGCSMQAVNFSLAACGVGQGRTNNVCAKCVAGRFAVAEKCMLCDVAKFQAFPGSTVCMSCPLGTIQPTTGRINCSICEPGSFSNAAQTFCESCAPGRFSSFSRSTACVGCEAGFYQPDFAGSACLSCSAGTYSIASAVSCTDCFPGRVSQQNGSGACIPCPPGTAQELAGQTQCDSCDKGTYIAVAGSPFCLQCTSGKYQNATRQTSCEVCAVGKAQISSRASVCDECELGQISAVLGAARCKNCPSGRFAAFPGTSVCALCDVGSAQPAVGSAGCIGCQPGTYSKSLGSQLCLQCDGGYFQNASGASFCTACSTGRFTNARAARQCMECAVGKYQVGTGQQRCMECAAGSFQPETSATSCMSCISGSAAEKEGSAYCSICPAATHSSHAATVCKPCAVNNVQPFENQSECMECPHGSFPNELATGCQCPVSYYAYSIANESVMLNESLVCVKCPPGSGTCTKMGQTFESITTLVGWWRTDSNATTFYRCHIPTFCLGQDMCQANREGPLCALCIEGYKSSGPGSACEACPPTKAASWGIATGIILALLLLLVVLYTLALRVANAQQARLFAIIDINNQIAQERLAARICTNDEHFSDLRKEIQHSRQHSRQNSRRNSRTGNFPSVIIPATGTFPANNLNTPKNHPNTPVNTPAGTISPKHATLTGFAATTATSKKNTSPTHSPTTATASTTASSFPPTNTADRSNVSMDFNSSMTDNTNSNIAAYLYETDFETGEETQDEHTDVDSKYVQLKATVEDTSRRAPNFMYKVKILIGFFQIASYLPSQGDIAWPRDYVTFIDAFSIFNFDFIPWQSLGCAAGINYFVKSVIVGLIPVAVTLFLVLFFLAGLYLSDTSSLQTQMEKGQRRAALWLQFIRLLLFTVFLLYPLVSKSALGLFNCVTVEGVSYLVADFELLCYDSVWTVYAAIDGIFVLLYPIGIPLLYFQILRRNFTKLREPETILSLGFLYEAYTDGAWFWELVDMLHKLVLTSVVVFTPNPQRMAWNMGIIGTYLILLLLCMPYVRKGDDRFHQQVQATLFCIAFVGFILREEDPYKTPFASELAMERLVAALLILIVLFLLLSFVVIAGRNVQKIIHARKRAKELAVNVLQPVLLNPFVVPPSASNSKSSDGNSKTKSLTSIDPR